MARLLALRTNGTVVGWEYNAFGQTDVPASVSNLVAIADGDFATFALRALAINALHHTAPRI